MIDFWLMFGLLLPFSVFFCLVMLEHLPELSEENYSNLSAIKGSMTKVSAIDMNKELKKIVTVVYLVIAVYFINQF